MEDCVLVPAESLSAEALAALLEEFITREGADYGLREYSLDEKKADVHAQLRRGEVVIAFDPESERVTLLRRDGLPRTPGAGSTVP